jgi:DNA-binding NarL/FixJ family response regulator
MNPEPPISAVLVEDDARVRRNLCEMLETAGNIVCIGAFPSAEAALENVPSLKPDVVLMDIHLPGRSGIECVRQLSLQLPRSLFMMLTSYDDSETLFESLSAGASGYLLKPVRTLELQAAVRDVFTGGSPMSSQIARRVVRAFRTREGIQAPTQPARPQVEGLSGREMEILTLLSEGYLYKEISDKLEISYATVRTHIERIYKKLHVQSRAQAVARLHGPAPR